LRDWPISVAYLRRLAAALARGDRSVARLPWLAAPIRNLAFMVVILTHGLARALKW
jgi:hypothetical protein